MVQVGSVVSPAVSISRICRSSAAAAAAATVMAGLHRQDSARWRDRLETLPFKRHLTTHACSRTSHQHAMSMPAIITCSETGAWLAQTLIMFHATAGNMRCRCLPVPLAHNHAWLSQNHATAVNIALSTPSSITCAVNAPSESRRPRPSQCTSTSRRPALRRRKPERQSRVAAAQTRSTWRVPKRFSRGTMWRRP